MLIYKINRQVAKDAKKTPSKPIWLRLGCAVLLRWKFFAVWKEFFSRVFLGPHASGVHVVAFGLLLHAGSVRSQESGLIREIRGGFYLATNSTNFTKRMVT